MGYGWCDNVLRLAGRILIVLGTVCLVCLAVILVSGEHTTSPRAASAAKGFVMFAALGLIPGFWMLRTGKELGVTDDRMAALADLMASYRRLKIGDAARKLAWTEAEVERIFGRCVERGLIEGYVDRATQELFTDESLRQEVTPPGTTCSRCGAALNGRFLTGETVVCPYCKARLA
ncbi:MAG: hypothetical protein HY815_01625 [Candidatus Riflebacteria bacterium]|nr:hypothetical protein [Candidatus Riflebacteria bacterium]